MNQVQSDHGYHQELHASAAAELSGGFLYTRCVKHLLLPAALCWYQVLYLKIKVKTREAHLCASTDSSYAVREGNL